MRARRSAETFIGQSNKRTCVLFLSFQVFSHINCLRQQPCFPLCSLFERHIRLMRTTLIVKAIERLQATEGYWHDDVLDAVVLGFSVRAMPWGGGSYVLHARFQGQRIQRADRFYQPAGLSLLKRLKPRRLGCASWSLGMIQPSTCKRRVMSVFESSNESFRSHNFG
jgi:hypothetical protein